MDFSTSLTLTDQFSSPLRNITNTLVNSASQVGFLDRALTSVDSALSKVTSGFQTSSSSSNAFNSSIEPSKYFNASDGIAAMGKALLGFVAIQKLVSGGKSILQSADEYAGIQSRLEMVTDDLSKVPIYNEAIYQSALRARGSYTDMAKLVSQVSLVASDTFKSPAEAIPFVENLQKMFAIGGSSAEEQSSALLQLQQALASGKLQGDELRSIAEAAPLVEKAIAKYMGVSMGEIKKLGSEGVITADIIKNAILDAGPEIEQQFATLGYRWQDIWTTASTVFNKEMWPVFNQLRSFMNSDTGAGLMNEIVFGARVAARAVAGIVNNVIWLITSLNQLYQAYSGPINFIASTLLYLVGVWAVYRGGIIAATIATEIWGAVTSGIAAISGVIGTLSTLAALIREVGFAQAFAALTASEMWMAILLPVAVVIGVMFALVEVFNYFAETNLSLLGVIGAVFGAMINIVGNTLKFVARIFLTAAEFIINVWKDPWAAAYNFFIEIWNNIVDYIGHYVKNIIELINKIPGVQIQAGIDTSSWKGARMDIEGGVDFSQYNPEFSSLTDAMQIGYDTGDGLFGGIKSLFKPPEVNKDQDDEVKKLMEDNNKAVKGLYDPANATKKNTGKTAKNTAKAVELKDEDLKAWQEAAANAAMAKFISQTITIDVGGMHNTVSSDVDIDGMYTNLTDMLNSHLQASIGGV